MTPGAPGTTDATDRTEAAPTGATAQPAGNVLATDLYALIVFLHKNCNSDLFEAVGALELSLSQIKLLHHLEDQPRELSLKEAAELVHVSMPAASRMVDDLVRFTDSLASRGYPGLDLHREVIPNEFHNTVAGVALTRRMKRVCLTDGGRTAIRRLNAARLSGLEQFVDDLTTPEKESLAQALQRLLEREDIAACRPEPLTT